MNLAFCLFKYFPYGGLQRDFMRIATLCRERGHAITVFAQEWQGEIPPGFNLRLIPGHSLTNHGKRRNFARQLIHHLDEGRFDVVTGFNKMPGLDIYYAADPCYRQRAQRGWRSLYGLSPRYRTFVQLENAVFSRHSSTGILVLTASEQAVFSHHYQTPAERFHVLPPGIARDRSAPENAAEIRASFRHEFAIGADENVVLMIGSGFKRKGLDRALHAMAALPADLRQKTHLMVVGEGNAAPYMRMARRLGIGNRVHILGGRADVPRFLLGADLLLHPAYSEAAGMVLLEALVAGLPVLVTGACGYAFHVTRAEAGRVTASPFDQTELNRLLQEMLLSPEKTRWQLNALSYAHTTDLYSLPATVVNLIEAKGREVSSKKSA